MVARYTDWSHIHVVGADRAAAAPYVPAARKLLGQVMQDASFNQLGTHKLVQKLDDGTVITAEKHGSIPRITIVPGASVAKEPLPVPDDFVVWPRDAEHPGGVDDDRPQMILRRYKDDWSVYRPGAYAAMFPEGLRRAGNLDWVGERGERVSWYGPSNGLFCDPYVKPRAQYGTWVFHLGRAILDVEGYQSATTTTDGAENHKWVLGACLRKVDGAVYLYTIQTYLPDTPSTAPFNVDAGQAAAAEPLAAASNTVFLCRYLLAGSAVVWDAVHGSRNILAAWSIPRMQQPWRFSRDGSQATSTAPQSDITNVAAYNGDDGAVETSPSAACVVYMANVDTGTYSSTSVSLTSAFQPFVYDWDADGNQVSLDAGWVTVAGESWPALRLGDLELPVMIDSVAYSSNTAGAVATLSAAQNKLLFMSIRDGVTVVLRYEYEATVVVGGTDGQQTWVSQIDVYRGGQKVRSLPDHSETHEPVVLYTAPFTFSSFSGVLQSITRNGRFLADLVAQISCSPLHLLYGVWLVADVDTPTAEIPLAVMFFGALYGRMPWPGSYCFGGYKANSDSTAQPVLLISGGSLAGFDTTATDFDGMPCVLSCATSSDTTVLSGPGFSGHFDDNVAVEITGESVHYADDTSLPGLTGMMGATPRFHPAWVLGRTIEQEAA